MIKKGVTLITLAIAIVVLAIIFGTLMINAESLITESEKAKFAEEIKLIEDAIEEYYITVGIFPVLSNNIYTAEEVVNLNTTGKTAELMSEIEKNKDKNSNFYFIDFDNINIKIESMGEEGSPDDIYVVSDNNNVYYLRGLEIGGETFFSLINISNLNKLD